ncbi:hypothetical protein FJZ19_02830 [Candidatus Pacearchaeota archaeon]|nr:hypothetical protein [Candidatus Pacearchaeota archaeon]
MLQDKLIEGTGSPSLNASHKGISVGARAYAATVRQEPCKTGKEFQLAYVFIGATADNVFLDDARRRLGLSNNYGAVFIPKKILKGVDTKSSAGIIKEKEDCYVVRGLLPTPNLRFEAELRGYLLKEEGIVFASPEDFPRLKLKIPSSK